MTNAAQHRSSSSSTRCLRLRTVTSTLALATLLLSAVTAARSQENEGPKRTLFTVLHAFTGGADGSNNDTLLPYDKSLILDKQGNLYGTVPSGGDVTGGEFSPCGEFGCGVVFKLDKAGKETVLHAFTGVPDGVAPVSGLVRDEDGNLFGTTLFGGTSSLFAGTVFKVDPARKETVLYSFTGEADGKYPPTGLVRDQEGNLYGVTSQGGDFSVGAVFKVDPTGKETVLYSFTGGADGGGPFGRLIRDHEGNLYGATRSGGVGLSNPYCDVGCGVVFKLDRDGKETVLYAFTGAPDGASPVAGLVRDEDGNFYGTTNGGGFTGFPCGGFGCGTVFKLTRDGKEHVLYAFTGSTDGEYPFGRLLLHDRKLYGATYYGGDVSGCFGFGCGVVYKIDRHGKETVLYTFTGGTDGASPDSGLVRDDEGNFYGTTESGGSGSGVIYKLKPPDDRNEDGRAETP